MKSTVRQYDTSPADRARSAAGSTVGVAGSTRSASAVWWVRQAVRYEPQAVRWVQQTVQHVDRVRHAQPSALCSIASPHGRMASSTRSGCSSLVNDMDVRRACVKHAYIDKY